MFLKSEELASALWILAYRANWRSYITTVLPLIDKHMPKLEGRAKSYAAQTQWICSVPAGKIQFYFRKQNKANFDTIP